MAQPKNTALPREQQALIQGLRCVSFLLDDLSDGGNKNLDADISLALSRALIIYSNRIEFHAAKSA